MATKFGVQLKSKGGGGDAPGDGDEPQGMLTASGARRSDFKTKPVSDLKSMFNKKDQEAKESSAVLTRKSSISSENQESKTVKTDFVGSSGNSKIQVSLTSKSSSVSGNKLTTEDKSAFEALRGYLNKSDINSLLDSKEPVAAVAKSKTFGASGGTYQATIEKNKVQTAQDDNSKVPVTKANAASVLSFGLTKLLTRPVQEPLSEKLPTKTELSKQSTPAVKEAGKEKIILGVAKGWKGNDDSVSKDLSKNGGKSGVFSASAVGKVRTEVKEEKEPKVKGFRSVSPVNFKSGSNDESVVSSNLSPRGYKPPKFDFNTQKPDETADAKTDINKNFKKLDISDTDGLSREIKTSTPEHDHKSVGRVNSSGSLASKLIRTDSKPKLSAVEQLAIDKERLKNNKNSGSFSSDSEKGKRSPKNKEEFKWLEKGRISLEEFKEQRKSTSPIQRPLSRASSSGSSSSLSRSDAVSVQSQINRVSSPDPSKQVQGHLSPFMETEVQLRKHREFAVSTRSKISVEKFTEIKKGFEGKKVESQTVLKEVTKPKLEVKLGKGKLLERKQSFEGGEIFRSRSIERQEVVSPRDRGNVLGTVKALAELDAKAKAQPEIMRRTKSLPSDSLEDDNSSSVDYDDVANGPLYQVVQEVDIVDDVSNEGDISSDADLIYEEIPAHDISAMLSRGDPENKVKFKDRRSMAFKKRQKQVEETPPSTEIQAGNDGDIDSDSDSIYEPIDDECDNISESDSLELPPEVPSLPPSRTQSTGNKKKKKEPKGEKGDKEKKGFRGKIKQFYKGRRKESEPTLSTSPASVQPNGSNSVLSKLKNLNKTKTSSSAPNLEELAKSSFSTSNLEEFFENNPVCDSEGTDTEGDVGEEMSKRMTKSEDEGGTEGSTLAPPPLPPRRPSSSIDLKGDNEYEEPKRHSQEIKSSHSSLNLDTKGGRTSPAPLPPRNRISNKLDLNVVIPVKPGGDARKSGWAPSKDSYLQTQKLSHPDIPFIDESPVKSPPSDPDAPPLPVRPVPVSKRHGTSTASTSSYVDADAFRKQKDSYVEVGESPLQEDEYSLADEIRKELEKRPISSAYINPTDLSTVPQPRRVDNRAGTPPVSEMMTYIQMADDMYLDLSEDQVYGTAGRYKSNLESESLYQFYNKDKITRASRRNAVYSDYFEGSDEEDEYSSGAETRDSIYEDLSNYSSSGRGSMELEKPTSMAPPTPGQPDKISTLEMFGKRGTVLRTLWSEMPEVKASGVLDTILPHERKLQEHMFEILTSEATYLKSMNILIDVFLKSQEFGVNSAHSNKCVITKQERHFIFSNIGAIRDASERFLASLEVRWKQNVVLSDICDIIAEHASKHFECYVHYCSNQVFQDRAVTELRKKPEFLEALRRLEHSAECQGLPMISFLLLPMQRITRLPLLVDAICHRMDAQKDKARHKSASMAFTAMSKVVKRCNDGAKKMQQTEQMYHISMKIEFPSNKDIPQIPLISASRYLIKQGEVTKILNNPKGGLPFGKAKAGKQNVNIFMFNDIILLTKKKGEKFVVTGYGQRNTLHIEEIESPEKYAKNLPLGVPSGCKNLFLLVILENHEKKQSEAVFACNTMSDRARWVDAVPNVKVKDEERIYEEWDCPQVQCIKKYFAQEPDELALEESDVVNVFKKLEDGMYEGERLRDGERGWFPKEYTVEIENAHVRARNMRMKYRLQSSMDST